VFSKLTHLGNHRALILLVSGGPPRDHSIRQQIGCSMEIKTWQASNDILNLAHTICGFMVSRIVVR